MQVRSALASRIARCVCIAGVRRRQAEGAGTTARRGPECDEKKR